jgi:hypothetical protein
LALAAVSVLALAQPALAQTPDEIIVQLCPAGASDSLPVIVGIVRDAATGEPVSRARVRISTLGNNDGPGSWLQVDNISAYVTSADDGTYAICGVPTGSRALLHASRGDRTSRFVGLFFLSGGVSTRDDFHQLDNPVWHQDLDILPRGQQTAVVIGQVTDTTAEPVVAAEVSLVGSSYTARTDDSGRFSFVGLAPGIARLEVRRLGFRMFGREVELIAGDTVDLSTSSLEHLPIQLAQLTVTGVAPSERLRDVGFLDRRRSSASGSFVTMAEYRDRWGDPVRTTEVLYSMRGLRPRSTSMGGGLGYVSVGFTRCGNKPPDLYVDGFYMGTGAEIDVNSLVPTDWLEGVEAYRDPSFVHISRRVRRGCGEIYLWTKPFDNEPEEDIPVEPGARVRVTAPAEGLRRYVGEYVAGDRDAVYVRGEAGVAPLAIPLTSVTLLELRTGEKRRRLLGTSVGLAAGAAVGAAFGVFNEDRALSVMVLAVPGTFVGFLVGSVLKTDRWEQAVQTTPLASGRSQRETRVGLGVSFRF